MSMLVLSYLLIFAARVADVTLSTIRILLLMRGKALLASVIGFFEVTIFILALNQVVGNLNDQFRLLAYALGFATGNFVGSKLEERLALGFATVQVISVDKSVEMLEQIRERGFGVTALEGCGREGTYQMLHVLLKRRDLPCFLSLVRGIDDQAFVSVMDTRKIFGGYFSRIKGT
jgi:uncharacterized protein YebE (UPF0316 family)